MSDETQPKLVRRFFDIGIEFGYMAGYRDGWDTKGDLVDYQLGLTSAFLAKAPMRAELEKRRALSHDPCPTRCSRCSRCIHSLSYWRRGGRDYLGVEAEAALKAKAAS